MSKDNFQLNLDDLMQKIKSKITAKYDLIVGIARGGILPGYLASRYLNCPFETLHLNFRDDNHVKSYDAPILLKPISFKTEDLRILLFDDVANSEATINKAKFLLSDAKSITTCVISGKADISLYGPHDCCIKWPWD